MADGDFPLPGNSVERSQLTKQVSPTQNQLRKKLLIAQQSSEEKATANFLKKIEASATEDPQQAITNLLQRQREGCYEALARSNMHYDPARAELEKAKLQFDPQEGMGPRVPWNIPDGHRMEKEPTVVSSYAGLCPQGIAAHKNLRWGRVICE